MVYKNGSYEVKMNEHMRGGDGVVRIDHLLSKQDMYDKGRLFARITLAPGCSIGPHVHEGEMEAFYIVSGTAVFTDGGETTVVTAGDTTLTVSGGTHSIRNEGAEPVELVALILYR